MAAVFSISSRFRTLESPYPSSSDPQGKMSKIIAVIGATGAQGSVVVKQLLAASSDGSPSPWKVRALTRSPNHARAKELEALGAEIVQGMHQALRVCTTLQVALTHAVILCASTGSFLDAATIHKLFEGAYGAFVNTDTFTVGASVEVQAAFVIVRLYFHVSRPSIQRMSDVVGNRPFPQASALRVVKP